MNTTATERSEFENVSDGVIGVNVEGDDGRLKGIPVKPGHSVFLSEREEIATANAPRRPSDNPFANGALKLVTRAADVVNRRVIGSREQVVPTVSEEELRQREVAAQAAAEAAEVLDQGNKPVPPPTVEKPAAIEEHGAPPLPQGDPALGVRAPGEEVATPEVVASGKRPPTGRGTTVKGGNVAAKPAAKPGVAQSVVVGQGGAQYVEAPE